MNISFLNKNTDLYGIFTVLMILLFISLSGMVFYQFIPVFDFSMFSDKVQESNKTSRYVILDSSDTRVYMKKRKYPIKNHIQMISEFRERLAKDGITTSVIDENGIAQLSKDTILIAPDVYALSQEHAKVLLEFLNKGGRLFFNFQFAYSYPNGKYRGNKLIQQITGLQSINRNIPKSMSGKVFMIPKLLSPLNYKNIKPSRIDLILYDPLPLLSSSKSIPDLILSDWDITSTPIVNNKKIALENAGLSWHGSYGKGSWYYFSFPMYTFMEMRNENDFISIVKNAIEFLAHKSTAIAYPFLDAKKAVFISEDTEYKYTNLIKYTQLCRKYDINTTLFCVVNLSEKYPNITKAASELKVVEIGSHSYSHTKIMGESKEIINREIAGSKKILEKITHQKVFGFRPPREEIDKIMADKLVEAGYTYTMEHTKAYLIPYEEYKGLITIPRHGTDDYQYIVRQKMDDKDILKRIISESKMLTSMNILYTLSTHTHLLSSDEHIHVTESYFKYLNKHKDISILKGKDIVRKAKLLSSISLSTKETKDNIIVTIDNKNIREVNNFTFRLYWPNILELGNIYKVESILSNLKVYERDRDSNKKYVDITIPLLAPVSKTTIFINYKE